MKLRRLWGRTLSLNLQVHLCKYRNRWDECHHRLHLTAITRMNKYWSRGIEEGSFLLTLNLPVGFDQFFEKCPNAEPECSGHNQRLEILVPTVFVDRWIYLLIEKFFSVRILWSSDETLHSGKMPKATLLSKIASKTSL